MQIIKWESALGELILKMSMSLDGFVSGLEGTNAWMFGSDTESQAWVWKPRGTPISTSWAAAVFSPWPNSGPRQKWRLHRR
ncbi:MAG: hypothetical protein MO852_02835 [Candidatus Devosia euplotis]|nr:hypothetical protein [Candidatus Devosia euplotis]